MKPIIVLAGSLVLGACAGDITQIELDDIRDARGDLPGFESEINCNRAPRIIFDKHGEIVETINPIIHPSCPDTDIKNAGLIRQGNMYVTANSGPSPYNEATDDDVVAVVQTGGNPTPTTGTPTTGTPTTGNPTQPPVAVIPCISLECEPTDAKEWVAWRRHFGIATTKQDIIDHVEKYGGTW